jgi:hypothetical protein
MPQIHFSSYSKHNTPAQERLALEKEKEKEVDTISAFSRLSALLYTSCSSWGEL